MYNWSVASMEALNASLEASMSNFTQFYKEHGIRTASQLVSLRKNEISGFVFPLGSVLHYTPRGTGTMGIMPDDPLLEHMGDRVLIDGVGEYEGQTIGTPIRIPRQFIKEMKGYVNKHKRFVYLPQAKALEHLKAIGQVVNYSSIDRSYRYAPRVGVSYQRMHNYFVTVISHIAKTVTAEKNHFLLLDTPAIIPAPSRLREAVKELKTNVGKDLPFGKKHLDRFDTDGRYLILQLWMWAGEDKEYSIFNALPKEKLDSINLLFTVDDKYSVLNLGRFNSWIKRSDDSKGLFTEKRAQLALLRHFMSLQQIATVGADVEIIDDEREDEIEASNQSKLSEDIRKQIDNTNPLTDATTQYKNLEAEMSAVKDLNIDASGMTKAPIDIKIKSKPKSKKEQSLDNKFADIADDSDEDLGGAELNEILGAELDQDIEQLEMVDAQRDADQLTDHKDYVSYKPKEFSHEFAITSLADKLADKGLLSAAEVRRAKNLSERYKHIKSPFNTKQTLEEFMPIDPETLKISGEQNLVSKPLKGVMDKSMLHYSIKDFDNRYLEDVLDKHIVGAIMHVQQAGIAVTDMNLKEVHTYLGSHIELSVQLTPIVGSPTTVKFKLPKVNSDGHFVANSVKYGMRKQFIQLPIRKVGRDEVTLTSNISKMFVNRTERVAFNKGHWIGKEINLLSMEENPKVTDIRFTDVFDPNVKLPLMYTSIASKMASFKFNKVLFNFDYSAIEKLFPEDILAKIDRTKCVPLALTKKVLGNEEVPYAYVMDMFNNVHGMYVGYKVPTEKYGSIANLLGLDAEREPVEYAEVKLKGKNIPVGILLGYQLGLGNLLKTSGCKFRREKRRSHFEVAENEFTVRFEDEVLIFDRRDSKACLLFNGFNRIKNTIKSMSIYSLDKQDAYGKLLVALGAKVQHTKEYDFMFEFWIDQITRSILEEMKEPTDLVLLFLRAIELLEDEQYADPNGISGSYIRGYQRFAGMIYKELATAVRQYKNNPQSKTAKIEINPNAVWFDILQDETVGPIEESNPIHAIKEKEVVVFRGAGGRSAQSMTQKHRQFAKDAIGIVSEANVDNGQVGTITYLTADPNITSLLGLNKALDDVKNAPATKIMSTAMALSPGSDKDD